VKIVAGVKIKRFVFYTVA